MEATAKVVLTERHLPIADDAKVPELVKTAQQALHLHLSSILPGPDSSEAVKKILGGVSSIAVGVAELRNRGYGSGHGQASTPTGLSPRHAHPAVNVRSPGASCASTPWLTPRRRGGASGLTCQVHASKRSLRMPMVEPAISSLPSVVHGMNAGTTIPGSNDQNLWMVLGWVR